MHSKVEKGIATEHLSTYTPVRNILYANTIAIIRQIRKEVFDYNREGIPGIILITAGTTTNTFLYPAYTYSSVFMPFWYFLFIGTLLHGTDLGTFYPT